MFNSYDWKNVITFKNFIDIAIKNKKAYILPNHYEIMDGDCMGIVDDNNNFIPLRFGNKSVRDILRKKLMKKTEVKLCGKDKYR